MFGDERVGYRGLGAVVGRPKTEYGMEPLALSETREACYKVEKRVDDMNVNGVLASMPFPQLVKHDGFLFHQYKDKKQALTLLRAYNDWHVDEWCAGAPGRFIPCPLVPTWDMDATVAELKRLSKKGVHSVTFHDNPANRGLPSPHKEYWDPFWTATAVRRWAPSSCSVRRLSATRWTTRTPIVSGRMAPRSSGPSSATCRKSRST